MEPALPTARALGGGVDFTESSRATAEQLIGVGDRDAQRLSHFLDRETVRRMQEQRRLLPLRQAAQAACDQVTLGEVVGRIGRAVGEQALILGRLPIRSTPQQA